MFRRFKLFKRAQKNRRGIKKFADLVWRLVHTSERENEKEKAKVNFGW